VNGAAVAAPWPERRQAALEAVDDARRATAAHVSEHLDALLDGLAEQGVAAAQMIDEATGRVLAGVAARAEVEQQVFAAKPV
jgi:hypothetical protein